MKKKTTSVVIFRFVRPANQLQPYLKAASRFVRIWNACLFYKGRNLSVIKKEEIMTSQSQNEGKRCLYSITVAEHFPAPFRIIFFT